MIVSDASETIVNTNPIPDNSDECYVTKNNNNISLCEKLNSEIIHNDDVSCQSSNQNTISSSSFLSQWQTVGHVQLSHRFRKMTPCYISYW